MRNQIRYNTYEWTDSDLRATSADLDTSQTGRVLDVDTASFVVDCADDLSAFFQNAPVRWLRGGSQISLWYLQSITRVGPNLWRFDLISSLGRVAQLEHRGGVFGGTATGTQRVITAGALIREICGYVNGEPTSVMVRVGDVFENIAIYGWLPYLSPSGEHGAQTGSAKDNLLQVIFAINATLRADQDGVLVIDNISAGVSSTINADRVYLSGASVRHEAPITALTLLEHVYAPGTESRELFSGSATGEQVVVFAEPMTALDGGGLTIVDSGANYAVVSGVGTLTGTPYAVSTREVSAAVTTTMSGVIGRTETLSAPPLTTVPYIGSTSDVWAFLEVAGCEWLDGWYFLQSAGVGVSVWRVTAEIRGEVAISVEALIQRMGSYTFETVQLTQDVPDGASTWQRGLGYTPERSVTPVYGDVEITVPNEVRIESATLVSMTNSADVLTRLVEYYKHRTWIEESCTIDFERCGDVVSLWDPYDKTQRNACIESISPLQVSQTLKGRVSALVGFTPWQVRPFSDEQIIIDANSASMTVVLPEGVNSVIVVLISGGSGGAGGMAGETGESGASTSASGGSTSEGAPGEGGAGGAPGAGGAGGSIYRQEILNIPENRTFVCAIGAGGAGGAAEGGAGSAGTATTVSFGDSTLSSADGSGSAAGYMDPISGTYFARSGDPGAPGGAGGDGISGRSESGGADTETVAPSGEAVDPHVGGAGATGFWFTGGYGTVSYTEGDWRQTEAPTQIPDDTQYSGWYNYRFNSTTGTYSATSNRSGTVYQGMGSVNVYSASGHTLTRTLYYWPSWRDYPSRSRSEQTATPNYGEMWGKVYGGSGGGGASGAADGSAAVAGTSTGPGTGGAGGAGGSRAAATVYGQGGAGGHGGGGGGGGGGSAISTHSNAGTYSCQGGYGGAPGAGGAGGAGAPGCVIFYYRAPTDEE